jgi:predicted ATPase
MIEHVQFQNFKALQNVSLDLSRLTVLVGPNGSGKTSVLEGMKHLGDEARRADIEGLRHSDEDRAEAALEAFNPLADVTNTLRLPTAGTSGLMLAWGEGDSMFGFTRGRLSCDGLLKGWGDCVLSTRTDDRFTSVGVVFGSSALPAVAFELLRLDPRELIAPSFDNREVPRVEPNGTGLASVLSYLASANPETFSDLVDAVREIIPNVRGLRFPRAPVKRTETEVITIDGKPFTHQAEKEYWGNSIEFDMENAPGIPASMVSEGTLLVLGLLTVILGPGRPRLLLLDDIDRALHPKAQGDLVALLRKLLDKFPEMQIVATSHSPYLLDHLRPEEVRLTTLKDDGTVAAGRLDEHPEFEKWRETMTPGEFWSMVGEGWLVDVRAGDVPAGEKG